jgi:hypothetical protein
MEFSKYFEKLPFFGVLTRWAVQVRALSTEEKGGRFLYARTPKESTTFFSGGEERGVWPVNFYEGGRF